MLALISLVAAQSKRAAAEAAPGPAVSADLAAEMLTVEQSLRSFAASGECTKGPGVSTPVCADAGWKPADAEAAAARDGDAEAQKQGPGCGRVPMSPAPSLSSCSSISLARGVPSAVTAAPLPICEHYMLRSLLIEYLNPWLRPICAVQASAAGRPPQRCARRPRSRGCAPPRAPRASGCTARLARRGTPRRAPPLPTQALRLFWHPTSPTMAARRRAWAPDTMPFR